MAKTIYNNRELSWLDFNERVMQEAFDQSVPLIQRLRFLGIYSNNQDEFFKVRVPSVKRMIDYMTLNKEVKIGWNLGSEKLMTMINGRTVELNDKFEKILKDVLSELEDQGVRIINEKELTEKQNIFVYNYFSDEIRPQLVPLIINKNNDFPFLQDDKIYLAVKIIKKKDLEIKNIKYFIIEIPDSMPRFIVLPESEKGKTDIMFIDDIIRLALHRIFFMFKYEEISAYTFKITRDAELDLDEDISKSLMEKIRDSLQKRIFGKPVRIVYDESMPKDLKKLIIQKLGLKGNDNITPGGRYHQMRDLMRFPVVNPKLEDINIPPVAHQYINPNSSIINEVKKRDLFFNFPYHSFSHIVDFLRESAFNPKVKEIYISVYRLAAKSQIINALVNAGKNGKKVVVFVELQARFDERNNMKWSDILQEAGVKVLPCMQDFKVHCKLILIKYKEGNTISGLTYVGTGNFNESTSKLYTDFGILTSNKSIATDAEKIFDFLEHNHKRFECNTLIVSPYRMRNFITKSIEKEIENAKAGKPAFIYAKLNSLVDENIISLLYKASQAGVKIKLLIRGICSLKAGVKGLSDNIEARSIVDRYLEHSRMYIFCNDNINKTYISSADWMGRNLDRRIEVTAPILDKQIAKILAEVFNIQWSDNVKARNLAEGFMNEHINIITIPTYVHSNPNTNTNSSIETNQHPIDNTNSNLINNNIINSNSLTNTTNTIDESTNNDLSNTYFNANNNLTNNKIENNNLTNNKIEISNLTNNKIENPLSAGYPTTSIDNSSNNSYPNTADNLANSYLKIESNKAFRSQVELYNYYSKKVSDTNKNGLITIPESYSDNKNK